MYIYICIELLNYNVTNTFDFEDYIKFLVFFQKKKKRVVCMYALV